MRSGRIIAAACRATEVYFRESLVTTDVPLRSPGQMAMGTDIQPARVTG
jgi:hypothetical protein